MSVTTIDREVTVVKSVRVYHCDGPECSLTVEAPATLKVMEVPPGWTFVSVTPFEQFGIVGEVKHYCSRDCLADAVVP